MTNAIDLLLAYLIGYRMTNEKIDIDLVIERAKEYKERETDTKVKEISFNSMLADSATAINQWCIENLGEKIMEKTDEERRQLYHYYQVVKYLAKHSVNLKFMQE